MPYFIQTKRQKKQAVLAYDKLYIDSNMYTVDNLPPGPVPDSQQHHYNRNRGDVILTGDFNLRVGLSSDITEDINLNRYIDLPVDEISHQLPKRSSYDITELSDDCPIEFCMSFEFTKQSQTQYNTCGSASEIGLCIRPCHKNIDHVTAVKMAGESLFDIRLYNIIVLGLSFMLIFTAFQTASMAEKSVLDSAKNDTENSNGTKFTGDGYTSLSIIYVVFSVSNWLAPSVIVITGPKWSMFGGSLLYFLFILSFLKPMNWALYTVSGLVGFGAAILWTGQGNFLTINSDSETISRNSGIFWALLQCSLLFGNAYSHFVLQGSETITEGERNKLFIGLAGAALLGSLMLLLLRKSRREGGSIVNLNSSQPMVDSPLHALKRSFYLMGTKEMLLLSIVIAYTGLELTFFSGVYSTCISDTNIFGDQAKGLIGISGMFIGVGEIIGGTLFGLLAKSTNRKGRDIIVMFGYVVHMACFYLIYLNLPAKSPIGATDDSAKITPNEYVAILCSFLLGLGDSSFNTQIYSLLGFMFPEDSSPAFAIFKFIQSVAAAVAFFYSDYLILQWQLLILVIFGSIGSLSFSVIEWESNNLKREGYQSI
ncbi:DUF895 domain membrane protein [Mactra antiquata]